MRVLHVSTGRVLRGGERQMLLLMAGLRDAGHEQRLIAPVRGDLAPRATEAGHVVDATEILNEGDVRAAGRIARRVRIDRPDVLHAHTSQAHGLGAVGARLAGRRRPAIIVTRRVEHSIFRHSFLRLDRLKYAPGADRVICVSDRVRQVLEADGIAADRLDVVPDGVDVERFASPTRPREAVRAELDVPAGALLVGNVGNLERAKGQHDLVEALPRIRAEVPGTHLLLVGGKARAELEALASEHGVTDAVHFAGAREDVHDLLHAMDVFAFPSRTEGLGSSILEAMAAGVPVVATRVGGIPEVVEDGETGMLVAPGDVDALVHAIARVHADPGGAASRTERARNRVIAAYDVTTMVAGTLSSYATACGASG